MLVVADTSALLALAACESLGLLDVLFHEVRVPPAVFRECVHPGKPGAELLDTYLRERVVDVDLNQFVIAAAGLGRGELEAMALYKKIRADRLLLDDNRARKVAQLNGLRVVGSVGVLLLAKSEGYIPLVLPLLDRIQSAGIYLSAAVIEEVLRLAGEA
jgi:predicted nucleic acid-binding protein